MSIYGICPWSLFFCGPGLLLEDLWRPSEVQTWDISSHLGLALAYIEGQIILWLIHITDIYLLYKFDLLPFFKVMAGPQTLAFCPFSLWRFPFICNNSKKMF